MLECRKVPRLPRETRLRNAWNAQNWTFLQNSSRVAAIGPSRGRLRTVVNGYGRLRTQTQSRANTPSTPRPQSETGTFATHSGNSFHSFTNGWQGDSVLCHSQKLRSKRYRKRAAWSGHNDAVDDGQQGHLVFRQCSLVLKHTLTHVENCMRAGGMPTHANKITIPKANSDQLAAFRCKCVYILSYAKCLSRLVLFAQWTTMKLVADCAGDCCRRRIWTRSNNSSKEWVQMKQVRENPLLTDQRFAAVMYWIFELVWNCNTGQVQR